MPRATRAAGKAALHQTPEDAGAERGRPEPTPSHCAASREQENPPIGCTGLERPSTAGYGSRRTGLARGCVHPALELWHLAQAKWIQRALWVLLVRKAATNRLAAELQKLNRLRPKSEGNLETLRKIRWLAQNHDLRLSLDLDSDSCSLASRARRMISGSAAGRCADELNGLHRREDLVDQGAQHCCTTRATTGTQPASGQTGCYGTLRYTTGT
ncbi:hypothetical protein CYMTET_26324 [Cymbomonas tetramitiformis]|uniref:Uncharacterized protein n=1 Tax=Cymbomonas tetramitiformis TaxID=36881 RepID=A0AAE0FRX4_9CHLO|nr:hypothetical protein CYMTET_26324 [Cymbomonas tetramitiformis]